MTGIWLLQTSALQEHLSSRQFLPLALYQMK
nr:MAG TPA: hypothetical protein [Caudoviricetes sp.]